MAAKTQRTGLLLVFLAVLFAFSCAGIPFDHPKRASRAIAPSEETLLGLGAAEWSAAHGGRSGFLPLADGMDALGARLGLIERAEVSIDAQYFLIKPDVVGRLFARALLRAADRGVRVRLLLDDIFTPAIDSQLALLDTHPRVEVRMFNPLTRESFRYWSLLVDFERSNRRMHNKSFTVDNSFTIVGGRNIASEYFQIDDEVEFVDLEVVGLGPVAQAVSRTFDEFWNSPLAVSMEAYGEDVDPDDLARWVDGIADPAEEAAAGRALSSPFLTRVLDGSLVPWAAEAIVVTDSPTKLETRRGSEEVQELAREIVRRLRAAQEEVILITPYFVPGAGGAELLGSLAERGVRVRVLTNSLASTNHVPVHSGYARYRKRLLAAGVEFHELRPETLAFLGEGEPVEIRATLHTKAMIFDRKSFFIGSLNLDPRSIDINTEMGLFLEAPDIARGFAQLVDEQLPSSAYRVVLEGGKVRWRVEDGKGSADLSREPRTGPWRRIVSRFYGLLPIEGQL